MNFILENLEAASRPGLPGYNGTACWLWQGSTAKGYGVTKVVGRRYQCHRLAVYATGREIPIGWHVDHLCRTPLCCNPDHLEPVPPKVNWARGIHANREKTTCPNGHPYDKKDSRGKRICSLCIKERRKNYER